MPIYAYKCADCGFEQDVMQKMSDAPLSECPSCGKPAFTKQLSAAGFQLKGSGYYATDFKNSGAKPAEAPSPACGTGACPACAG
ncbi:MAG: zinc ribbon domain-containing protein [Thiobacillaceae bacterium]|jgi:putative FmdB family regulatory protein|nr:zinc ribbon domain-containing protein [Hydrogenophilales bacterium]MBP8902359.1 zinc ribbon domain-containing protein [Thiobacillaceae bacterium]MBP9916300.1 zinc ribbon domain-containing protein [Thiobacillaceae bacterium]